MKESEITPLLPEFSRDVPSPERISTLVKSINQNRNSLIEKAEEFGLNPEFLEESKNFIVGPFVYSTPIPTTFAGNADRYITAIKIGEQISQQLEKNGFTATPYASVELAMSQIATKNDEDCFIVPKNREENQKLPTIGKVKRGKSYEDATVTSGNIERINKTFVDSFNQFVQRVPAMRHVSKETGRKILTYVQNDVNNAWKTVSNEDETVRYLDYARSLNTQIIRRMYGDQTIEPKFIHIDTEVYSSFFSDTIEDISLFTRTLEGIGFFEDDPNFMKIVDDAGYPQILRLEKILSNDIALRYNVDGTLTTFSELRNRENDQRIAPCKELTYLLCFSNMVPVVYGSQNTGGYYEPYAKAKQQVQQLGLTPTMYRIQPEIKTPNVKQLPTVFDFYRQMLERNEEFKI